MVIVNILRTNILSPAQILGLVAQIFVLNILTITNWSDRVPGLTSNDSQTNKLPALHKLH